MPDLSEPSDRLLLERHRAGDPEAFGEIVRRHRDRMWAVALRTLGDPEEAADAVQDALVSAYRAAEGFRGDSAITTWLHRIVVNACLDRARRKSVRKTVPLPEQENDEDRGGRDLAVAADPTEGADVSMDIAAALATLPVDQRAALVLVDLQGYPVDEAGKILGVPTGTVKSRCARGRARLLPLLSHLRQGNENGSGCVEAEVKDKVVPLHNNPGLGRSGLGHSGLGKPGVGRPGVGQPGAGRNATSGTGGPSGQSGPAEGVDRRT